MSIDLQNLFSLKKEITLILPSKTQNGDPLVLTALVEEFSLKITKIFGGCQAQTNFKGYYTMQDGSVMIEDNACIVTSCEANKDLKEFLELCLFLKMQYKQESVAFKIDGVLYFC